ncbi:MAG TPA: extracellular solute-binding protein [Propionibacteriaceae bacterium]|nr:extracellular solute-binding protein [Propionibacteriaceae bacterium]
MTWANFANPGEAARFKEFSADYQKKTGTQVKYQTVVGTYATKMITQLAGGAAPDVFYNNDELMAKSIESGSVMALDDYLNSADAKVKAEDSYPGLLKMCQKDGKTYGIPVDCNPKVFWFNKKLLTAAGVTQDPAAMFEAGTWNQAALDDLLTKVKASGKTPMPLESTWFDLCGWITTFGGKAIDDKGRAIFDQDPKALSVIEWLFQNMKDEKIQYAGSLPKGQALDALFLASQMATIQYGRWILPNIKKIKGFEYDIAPLPSESGKDVAETAVYTVGLSVNAKAKDPKAALDFMAAFTNADGQRFRLTGGGNAVPSVNGLDDVVTEGNLPPHGKYFTEVAKKGYTIPQVLVENPAVSSTFVAELNKIYLSTLKSGDVKSFAAKAANLMNGKA